MVICYHPADHYAMVLYVEQGGTRPAESASEMPVSNKETKVTTP